MTARNVLRPADLDPQEHIAIFLNRFDRQLRIRQPQVGLFLATSSATSSPVIGSLDGSQETINSGLRLDRPVGSIKSVVTPSIIATRFEVTPR